MKNPAVTRRHRESLRGLRPHFRIAIYREKLFLSKDPFEALTNWRWLSSAPAVASGQRKIGWIAGGIPGFNAQDSHERVNRKILIISGSRPAVQPVRAVLFYQLIVDAQQQKGGGPLPNERRIMMFVGRFKKKRGKDRTDSSPQEKV